MIKEEHNHDKFECHECACCGACIYWDNIALAGERWACVHPEKDLKSEIDDVCDFFLPRRKG